METISEQYVKSLLKKRRRTAHKGDFGRILIAAGSPGMAGAAVLCARAAFRSGAGLVAVSIETSLFPVIHGGIVEATCVGRDLSAMDLNRYDAIAAGPGMNTDEKAFQTLEAILSHYEGTLILDADALTLLALHSGLSGLARRKQPKQAPAGQKPHLPHAGEAARTTPAPHDQAARQAPAPHDPEAARLILTPHAGEAARLLQADIASVDGDRPGAAAALSQQFHAVIILKGYESIVATPEGHLFLNPTGNPGMATGGSGDVLTGLLASLTGQGLSPKDAAKAGVFLHGMAGDMKAAETGEYGLIASDLADMLPRVFYRLLT